MTALRVLYVNWVDYLDAERRGGGVTLYQRNLMEAFEGGSSDIDTVFLASGTSYDLPIKAPRWEQVRHGPDTDRGRRFEIINSGVLAPSHFSFGQVEQVREPATREVFFDFLDQNGPFDVVHFNNLEGLPAEVLSLKDRFPKTRVILALHNYYPFCPQVNLWREERVHCSDFEKGQGCISCLERRPPSKAIRAAAGLAYRLKSVGLEPGQRGYDWTLRGALGLARRVLKRGRKGKVVESPTPAKTSEDAAADAKLFVQRRSDMVDLINTHCDKVLCVSDAVRQLALAYGTDPELAKTCYIGTAQADQWQETQPNLDLSADVQSRPLRVVFLGYMRRDKGFFFMLDALEAAPDAVLRRVHLIVAARGVTSEIEGRLRALRSRMAGLEWQDGYQHDELGALLSDVDVGIVPVLWEDCLPQVAIELHSRHIPLICSNIGGAKELANAPDMVFPSGDGAACAALLAKILDGKVDFEAYWRGAMTPITMDQHLEALKGHYHP